MLTSVDVTQCIILRLASIIIVTPSILSHYITQLHIHKHCSKCVCVCLTYPACLMVALQSHQIIRDHLKPHLLYIVAFNVVSFPDPTLHAERKGKKRTKPVPGGSM